MQGRIPGTPEVPVRRRSEPPELDLVPVMNLVTILIPFLLFSASFVSLAAIDSTLPALVDEALPKPKPDPALELALEISTEGYELRARQPLPLRETVFYRQDRSTSADTWPSGELADALAEVKREYPEEDTLILVPSGSIPYEVLVRTMDAARGQHRELFPSVVMAGGA